MGFIFVDVQISETDMIRHLFFNFLIIGWLGLAVISFFILLVIPVPYGRYIHHKWGLTIKNKIGWLVMEAPSPIVFLVCFVLGQSSKTLTAIAFLSLWEMHYVHRAFIYPFRLRGKGKRMPIMIMLLGFMFNMINSFFISLMYKKVLGNTDYKSNQKNLVKITIDIRIDKINFHSIII